MFNFSTLLWKSNNILILNPYQSLLSRLLWRQQLMMSMVLRGKALALILQMLFFCDSDTLDYSTFFVSLNEERVQEFCSSARICTMTLLIKWSILVHMSTCFQSVSLSSYIYEYHVKSMEIEGISCKKTFIWLIDY